jgi:hypothetical protein
MLFLPQEDELLAIGIAQFGADDWNEVQAYCLPTRTTKHLRARYKLLTSRRGPDNSVRRIYLNQIHPLNLAEREMLVTGVRQIGPNFCNLLERVFPRSPKALLARTWDALHNLEQVPISFTSSCEQVPALPEDSAPPALHSDVILCRHIDSEIHTVAGAGLDYIEQSVRLMLKERNLPSKDLRSRLSKGLQHAVIGGKICPLYSQSCIGPKLRDPLDLSAVPKRKVEAVDAIAMATDHRKKRLKV